jgi:hypothetical protein
LGRRLISRRKDLKFFQRMQVYLYFALHKIKLFVW